LYQSAAKSLQVFARSSVWITPQLGGLLDATKTPCPDDPEVTKLLLKGTTPFHYSPEEMEAFRKDTKFFLTFRRALELQICDALDYCKMGSEKHVQLFKLCKDHMEKVLDGHDEIKKNLIPTWAVGCRRPTPG